MLRIADLSQTSLCFPRKAGAKHSERRAIWFDELFV
jgi:hypothetical protein